jgi:hypothetical protein
LPGANPRRFGVTNWPEQKHFGVTNWEKHMRKLDLRLPSVADRRQAAAEAKKQALERYRAKLNYPGFTKRQAARRAVVE